MVDGEHFFDIVAEDAVFEYIITVPGYPRRVERRAAVAELYRPYGQVFVLDRCYDLAVHHDQHTGGNRYISVLTIRDRKIVHWRDYLDPVVVFNATGWPEPTNP